MYNNYGYLFQSLSVIIDKILRQAIKPTYDSKLVGRGLPAALLTLYPNVEWGADNITVFMTLIERIHKIFRKLNDTVSHFINLKHSYSKVVVLDVTTTLQLKMGFVDHQLARITGCLVDYDYNACV